MTAILVSDVARQVGRTFGDTDQIVITNADIIDWTNEAQLELARTTEILTTTITSAGSTFPLAFPSACIRLKRILYNTWSLVEADISKLDDLYVDYSLRNGSPEYYYMRGQNINLFPLQPTGDTTTVTIDYVASPVKLTVVGDSLGLPEVYNPDIIKYVLAKAHERNENQTAYQAKMAEFQQSVNFASENESRKTNTYPVIGDDPWENW